jgi:ligand-binding sensor domain-containing protein
MKICCLFISTFFLLLSLCRESYGQVNIRFESITVRQGLSNNLVWTIYQDREGFMWFGTEEVLNKYDGYSFTVFQPDPANAQHTLKHNYYLSHF